MSENLNITLESNGVLHVQMCRTDVHNAFDEHLIVELTDTFASAGQNEQVRVVVLSGAGKHFSAGGDINYMKKMGDFSFEENVADARRLATLMHTLHFLPKPTIARVQGAAYGGGFGLICCSDIVVGANNCKLCLSEVKIGLAPATIAPYVLRAVGQRQAKRLAISAEVIDAEKSLALGLLHHVVDESELDNTVNGVINAILANSPSAVSTAKQTVFDIEQGSIDESMIDKTAHIIAGLRGSEEGREGLKAFLEKRKPSWWSNVDS